MNGHEVFVLVPDAVLGVSVVSVAELAATIDEADTIDEATINIAIDSTFTDDIAGSGLVERVRKLNATGDAKAYWSMME